MSVPVGLINRRNSQSNKINFTRSKLSKNIDSNNKVRNKFMFAFKELLVEASRIELPTPCLQSKCSPN